MEWIILLTERFAKLLTWLLSCKSLENTSPQFSFTCKDPAIKPVTQSQKVYLQWKWEVIDTALTAALRSTQVQLLPRMPHSNSGKMKQTPITSSSAERFPKQMLKQGPFKVARTYLTARRLCSWIAFFDRNDLTDFHDFWHPNNEQ